MIRDVIVLGAGSAGLMAALALQRKLPMLRVRILRSQEIGVIGVGEGTTPLFPQFLFQYLQLDRADFYREAEPTFKLGGRFLKWGPRPFFDYPFERTYDVKSEGMQRLNAWYADLDYTGVNLPCALMAVDKAFPRDRSGKPLIIDYFAFHVENVKFVGFLENAAKRLGVEIVDGTVSEIETGPQGVTSLGLEDGRRFTADLFIDASGFRAELMRALGVKWRGFEKALFCDRAVIGGWKRTHETIQPYTTAETMDAGWCWRIEHEHFINRGYVFSSRITGDEEARDEFLRRNPAIAPESTRVVKFSSGRQSDAWKDNVIAIGNACGFVEPLEATALTLAAMQLKMLIQTLDHSSLDPTPCLRALYNRRATEQWDDVRDFLAMHYRFNTAVDTPFWQACRHETDLGPAADFVDFYHDNGPSLLAIHALPNYRAIYGLDGHFAMLSGQQVPWQNAKPTTAGERATWERIATHNHGLAKNGCDVRETLAAIRSPGWIWPVQPIAGRTALQL